MKKAYNSKRKFCFFPVLLCICLSFFNLSCGLDVVDAVLEDPFVTSGDLPAETSNFELMTFNFSTLKLDNANDFGKGYVYYKIYNNRGTKESEKGNLDSITSDSARRNNAYTSLINNYSYQPLHFVKTKGDQLEEFSFDNKAQTISIRLTNYGTDEFSAKIVLDGTTIGIPMRFNDKTFDFGRDGDFDEKPVKVSSAEESTSDVRKFSDNPDNPNILYVVLYGIFYMPNESFEKTIYSPVHYLGEVTINASVENN